MNIYICFRNHLQSTGNLELKTTTSEAFLADRRAEKMEKIKRDNLKISGERILKTTHNDFKVVIATLTYMVSGSKHNFSAFWRHFLI